MGMLFCSVYRNIKSSGYSILNCAARLVKRHSNDRASPLLFELHWLPVEQRITFKILLFVFERF